MFRFKTVPTLLMAVALAACGASRSPVPLVGADVSALTGQWTGEYSSAESGRSGSISFTLRASRDSAFGDVVMVPAGFGRPLSPYRGGAGGASAQQMPQTEVLTINFVRVEGGRVNGTLAPYADPQTGARLTTRFEGTLSGDTIEGTYTTNLPTGDTQTGRWKVERRK
jgi:hypothetical protein